MKRVIPLVLSLAVVAPTTTWAQSAPSASIEVDFSVEDQRLIREGEMSTAQAVIGGVVGTFVGLGTGQAVQGRYMKRGWIFTVGELGSLGVMVAGMASCADLEDGCNTGLLVGGAIGLIGFRAWELIDVWASPFLHNSKVQRARDRARAAGVSGYVAPTGARSGMAGVSMSF